MAGVKALRKIQLGLESTKGTAVAATALWRGTGTIEDKREVVFPDEDIGYLSGVDRSYTPKYAAALSFDDAPATYEQLPYVLSAGVKDVVTGAADGAGPDKVYTYTFPTTSKKALKTYALEGGDDQQAEEMEYAYVEAFKISGKGGEALMVQADWVGRQVALSTFTGAIAVPTVEEMLFGKTKLYLDAVGGTLGATQKTNTLLEFELAVKTGWIPKFTADGSLYFSFHESTMPEVTLSLTYEHDATGVAGKADWRAETPRQIRLLTEGSSVATPGTTYSVKTMKIDVAGKWEAFDKIDEVDGNDVVKGTMRIRYDSTAALFASIIVVNELVSLT